MRAVGRLWMAVGAVVGWFALLLQFYLSAQLALANGRGLLAGAITYFSFFTILTNLWIALQWSAPLWAPRTAMGRWYSRPAVQAASAVYIAIVGVIYTLLLRHIWNPQGWQKLADILLHDAAPLLYVGYWCLFAPKHGLRWQHAVWWLLYPLTYVAYTLAHGAATGWYPYPFCDVALLGYPRALGNTALVLLGFLALGLLTVVLGRALGRQHVGSRRQRGAG